MSLLASHKGAVINDIEDLRNHQPTRTKHLTAMKDVITVDYTTSILRHEEIDKRLKVLMDDYTMSLEEDSLAEETLVKTHLRRLRNLYIALMEIYKRDEKLLPW